MELWLPRKVFLTRTGNRAHYSRNCQHLGPLPDATIDVCLNCVNPGRAQKAVWIKELTFRHNRDHHAKAYEQCVECQHDAHL